MGLIRLILLLLVAWLVWRLVKRFKALGRSSSGDAQRIAGKSMVKCQFCSVHLPESEALPHQQHWFCSAAHKRQYLMEQGD